MKILVLNSGSSSLKYQMFDWGSQDVIAKGVVERIGLRNSVHTYKPAGGEKHEVIRDIDNHRVALKCVMDLLTGAETGVIDDVNEINAVGHRVVHGGEEFAESAIINDAVLKAIEDCESLAPLHNPANKEGILACMDLMPETPQVAVFDTAFHQTMKPENFLYAIPYKYYKRHAVRRYGFHGTSHKYVYFETAKFLGADPKKLKVLTLHIGNGASIAAIDGGKVVDTSMGFTPLEGLVMGTRSGDLDPAVLLYIMDNEQLTFLEMNKILNKQSGVYGVSGISSDMREIETAAERDNEQAILALDIYVNRIIKYIGAYNALLNGIDALVFTAGVGENSLHIRELVVKKLGWLGMTLDPEKNKVRGEKQIITTEDSDVKALIMPTNEEYMIASDTYTLTKDL